MNEQLSYSADILNRLFRTEMQTLLPRLIDLGPAFSLRQPKLATVLITIARHAAEHRDWLAREIEAHRGTPEPATLNIESAGLHYSSGESLVPRIQQDVEQLIAAYTQASRDRRLTPSALDLVTRIIRRYEAAVAELEPAPAVAP